MPSLRTPPRSGAGAPAGGGGDVESGVVSTAIPGAIPPSSRRAVYAVTLVAVLFWALVLLFVAYVRYGGDIRGLLCLGANVDPPGVFEAVPRAGPAGDDGQQGPEFRRQRHRGDLRLVADLGEEEAHQGGEEGIAPARGRGWLLAIAT